MKAAFFFLTFALSTSLFAQDSAFTFTGFGESCNLQDLEMEKQNLDHEIQVLAWSNEDLMDAISKKKVQNQQIQKSAHSAARIHLNQNLEQIRTFEVMIEKNNADMEARWHHAKALDLKINSAVCQIAINP